MTCLLKTAGSPGPRFRWGASREREITHLVASFGAAKPGLTRLPAGDRHLLSKETPLQPSRRG